MSPGWFRVPAPALGRRLLGCELVSAVGGRRTAGRIVETEAYLGPEDPASHAAVRAGRTERNASMFGDGGTAYLYFTYGMHWCFNVVAGMDGEPGAVLVRALEPTCGREVMADRRGRDVELTTGPARLCQALGLDGTLDGHRLDRPPLWIEKGDELEPERIEVTGRIGIRRARRWPLRFVERGDSSRSRVRGPAADSDAVPPELRARLSPGMDSGSSR